MKILIKKSLLFLFVCSISICVKAQPKAGSMIIGYFESNLKNIYVAAVLSSDSKEFTGRISQTNSLYVFKLNDYGEGIVVSTKGGKFPIGSKFIFLEYRIIEDTYGCILTKKESSVVIAKFDDGKSFLGYAQKFETDNSFSVYFWHSGSTYKFDKNGVILSQSGGSYAKGRSAKIYCAEATGPLPVGMVLPNSQKDELK